MKNTKGLWWIILGAMLILSALFLVFYNFRQDSRSGETASEILSELKEALPQTEAVQTTEFIESATHDNNNIFEEYEEVTETLPEA